MLTRPVGSESHRYHAYHVTTPSRCRGIRVVKCRACGDTIATRADFVLAGKYPGLSKKYWNFDFYGLDYYGPCYHKDCYDRAVRGR